jgi:hypothetical protein
MSLVLHVPLKPGYLTCRPRAAWLPPTVKRVRTAADVAFDGKPHQLASLVFRMASALGPEGLAAMLGASEEDLERTREFPAVHADERWLASVLDELHLTRLPATQALMSAAYDREYQRRQVAHA